MKTLIITVIILFIYSIFTSFKLSYSKYYDDASINILVNFDIFKKPLNKQSYKLQLPKIYILLNLCYLGCIIFEINNAKNSITYQD